MAHNEEGSNPLASSLGRTATERVLNTPELLRAVFDVLEPELTLHPRIASPRRRDRPSFRSVQTRRATLAACARVSLLFSHLALDVLWTAIDRIEWLLNVLPTIDYVQNSGTPTLTGEITDAAWAHFQTYAVRIRKLAFIQRREDRLIWTKITHKCQGQPLLPNLRFLESTWETTEERAILPIHILLSPSLHTVCIIFNGLPWPNTSSSEPSSVGLEQLCFEAIVNSAPQLKVLHWAAFLPPHSPPTYLYGIGQHFPRLENLTWTTPSPITDTPVLHAISAIPSLQTLRLAIKLPAEKLTFSTPPFGNLRTLDLTASFGDVVQFMHCLKLPTLGVLLLRLTSEHRDGTLTPSDLQSNIPQLCAGLPPALTHFSLVSARLQHAPESIDKTVGISDILTPLFRFKHLEHVSLDPPMLSVLRPTDDDLASAGAAWPRLQSLNLFGCCSPEDTTDPDIAAYVHISIWGVFTLAQRCPQLSRLFLPVFGVPSPRRIPRGSVVRVAPFVKHPLRHLEIGMLVPESKLPLDLAAGLRWLFPRFAEPAARYVHGREPLPRRFVMTVPE